jgi:hypothetical protein
MLRFDPDDEWPVLLASIRDEYIARPAVAPARWWPDSPQLIGGKDVSAGGTWLALDTAARRVAAVYTPGSPTTKDRGLLSRGLLPLVALNAAAAQGTDATAAYQAIDAAILPTRYEPFSMLVADAGRARWTTWKEGRWTHVDIAPGVHALNNWGLDVLDTAPRQCRWLPPFAAAVPQKVLERGDPRDTWGGWIDLLGQEPEPDKDDSLLLRRMVKDKAGIEQPYGTKSASLVAIGREGVRYDATEQPWDATTWAQVETD